MSTVYKRGHAVIEANLTPMIDVTFLLIVFFVLVSQIVEVESVPMDLPAPSEPVSQRAGEEQRAVVNVIPGTGGRVRGYRLGTRTYPASEHGVETLTEHLGGLLAGNPRMGVNLRVDRACQFQFVDPLLQAIATAASRVPESATGARVNLVVIRED
jgi:biopolymer transport protein ExbD